jgi:hypothetical protein
MAGRKQQLINFIAIECERNKTDRRKHFNSMWTKKTVYYPILKLESDLIPLEVKMVIQKNGQVYVQISCKLNKQKHSSLKVLGSLLP